MTNAMPMVACGSSCSVRLVARVVLVSVLLLLLLVTPGTAVLLLFPPT